LRKILAHNRDEEKEHRGHGAGVDAAAATRTSTREFARLAVHRRREWPRLTAHAGSGIRPPAGAPARRVAPVRPSRCLDPLRAPVAVSGGAGLRNARRWTAGRDASGRIYAPPPARRRVLRLVAQAAAGGRRTDRAPRLALAGRPRSPHDHRTACRGRRSRYWRRRRRVPSRSRGTGRCCRTGSRWAHRTFAFVLRAAPRSSPSPGPGYVVLWHFTHDRVLSSADDAADHRRRHLHREGQRVVWDAEGIRRRPMASRRLPVVQTDDAHCSWCAAYAGGTRSSPRRPAGGQ